MRKHELPLLREDIMRIVLPASICLILVVVVVCFAVTVSFSKKWFGQPLLLPICFSAARNTSDRKTVESNQVWVQIRDYPGLIPTGAKPY